MRAVFQALPCIYKKQNKQTKIQKRFISPNTVQVKWIQMLSDLPDKASTNYKLSNEFKWIKNKIES